MQRKPWGKHGKATDPQETTLFQAPLSPQGSFAAQETLVVHSKHWRRPRGLYYDLLGTSGSKLKSAELLPVDLDYDS